MNGNRKKLEEYLTRERILHQDPYCQIPYLSEGNNEIWYSQKFDFVPQGPAYSMFPPGGTYWSQTPFPTGNYRAEASFAGPPLPQGPQGPTYSMAPAGGTYWSQTRFPTGNFPYLDNLAGPSLPQGPQGPTYSMFPAGGTYWSQTPFPTGNYRAEANFAGPSLPQGPQGPTYSMFPAGGTYWSQTPFPTGNYRAEANFAGPPLPQGPQGPTYSMAPAGGTYWSQTPFPTGNYPYLNSLVKPRVRKARRQRYEYSMFPPGGNYWSQNSFYAGNYQDEANLAGPPVHKVPQEEITSVSERNHEPVLDEDSDVVFIGTFPSYDSQNENDDEYSDGDSITNEYGLCTICFDDPRNPIGCLKCKQLLGCRTCVYEWYNTSKVSGSPSCPLCRESWGANLTVGSMRWIAPRL